MRKISSRHRRLKRGEKKGQRLFHQQRTMLERGRCPYSPVTPSLERRDGEGAAKTPDQPVEDFRVFNVRGVTALIKQNEL